MPQVKHVDRETSQGKMKSTKPVRFILLMGPRACGKTTVAAALAERLPGWNALDLDQVYETRHGRQSDLRADLEVYYDRLKNILLEYVNRPNLIVSTSGGSLVNSLQPFGNIEVLLACKASGKMILLLPSRFDFRNRLILYRREAKRNYGLPREAKLKLREVCERSYTERIDFFRGNADLIIYGGTPAASAARIDRTYDLAATNESASDNESGTASKRSTRP